MENTISAHDSELEQELYSTVTHDISERKRMVEAALQESEEKFYKIFNTAPVAITISTVDDGKFIDINNEGVRLSGFQRDEVIGHTTKEFNIWKSPEERARVFEDLQKHGVVSEREMKFLKKGGQTLWGLYSAVIIDIRGKQHLLSMVSDITERKRAAEVVKQLTVSLAEKSAELVDVNKDLEAFNYTVAHDLRNPMNVISMSCQAIKELYGDQLPAECLEYVQDVYSEVLRMNRLIEDLLKFSHMGHVKLALEKVNLSALAYDVAKMLKKAEPERQTDFRIMDGIEVNADASLMRVVLDNLLGNAWKYTGMQEKAVIEFGTTEISGKQVYYGRDNGTGFDMADADNLFKPFQRLPGVEEFKGSGIGLATVERIILLHRGRIWAEGKPGKGATFYFTLSA